MSFLGDLKELWLSHNRFEGLISDEGLSYLRKLRYLSLGNNHFTGPIPKSIKHLNELELLCVGCNSLSGELPAAIHSLSNLRYLYLHNNNFTGEIPDWIGDFHFLTELSLEGNHFSGTNLTLGTVFHSLLSSFHFMFGDVDHTGYVYKDLHDVKRIARMRVSGSD